MTTRLFVGNLPENTAENELRTVFSSFGEIVNLDLKTKPAADTDSESKKFAFVTLSAPHFNIASCIKHFSTEGFYGNKLYVTQARESFLERLQRERLEAEQKAAQKKETQDIPIKIQVKKPAEKLNFQKKKPENVSSINNRTDKHVKSFDVRTPVLQNGDGFEVKQKVETSDATKKKQMADTKRMEAMKKKRREFKEKQMIVKTGLTSVDTVPNKKIKFSDSEENSPKSINGHNITTILKPGKKNVLFDDDDENDIESDKLNFDIKNQFEGKKGQKILDLQSRYKSDKRFILDERFIEDEQEVGDNQKACEDEDQIEVNQSDEKDKQLNILQDVLGVAIKRKIPEEDKDGKKKPKIGMLRYDPTQPEHAKFLAPIDNTKQEPTKKSKKKKDKVEESEVPQEEKQEEPRPEVSKEQFYKVSDTLKEAIAQPTSFSLRSLFGNKEEVEEEHKEENYAPLDIPKKAKMKNPLEPREKNPFVYDSSDSEAEETEQEAKIITAPIITTENKAVWKESLFFGISDQRLQQGLDFFISGSGMEIQKERRELKSLMKKRIYNKERKTQMFQKKIGGRKPMKKNFRKKS